jgi:hypothetical protein
VTDPGTVNLPLLLAVTEVAAETVWDSLTVQVVDVESGYAIADGLHVTDETSTASLNPSVCVEPYPCAVRVTAVELAEIVPAVAVNVVEVAPDGMVMDAGTLNAATLLESANVSDAVEAAAICTVQVAVEELAINCVPETAGREHVNPVRGTAGTTAKRPVCETPLYDAVTVTD